MEIISEKSKVPAPSLWTIFFTWFLTGIQSFGGGSSTFILIHQACIDHGWISEEDFLRSWSLSQISPGINLLKLTTMITYKLRGWGGVVAGVLGLLVPSAGVTVLMTAGFASIRSQPFVQAAMKGILPATIGLSLAMGVQMAAPLLSKAHKEGAPRFGLHILILLVSAVFMALNLVSPVLVMLLAGVVTVGLLAVVPVRQAKREVKQ